NYRSTQRDAGKMKNHRTIINLTIAALKQFLYLRNRMGHHLSDCRCLKSGDSNYVVWRTAIVSLVMVASAHAHKPSDSYLRIRTQDEGSHEIHIEWDIAIRDLELFVGLDEDQDQQVTWGELRAKEDAIVAQALSHLELASRGTVHQLSFVDLKVNDHSDGAYAALKFACNEPVDMTALGVRYSLLFDVDPTHRGLVLFDDGVGVTTHVLSPNEPSVVLSVGESSLLATLGEYVKEGVWHIWIGIDHILFLLALLLPAVFIYSESEWKPVDAFKPAFRSVLKVVTVFTIAHSVTLWLSVMEYVTLPNKWVEATIAFSIIVTAFNNLYDFIRLPAWMIAFGFGLIHGFGFASVLIDLGLSNQTLAASLFGFNVGVEFGQLVIVAAFLPLAFLIRRTTFYRRGIFQFGSILIAIVAAIWVYERVAQVEILGV
ncbi:MAG: HupE/UreJ family protein, partial [Planctomycetota bacterium]